MKKIIALLLAAVMCLSLCACGSSVDPAVLEAIQETVTDLSERVEVLSQKQAELAEAAAQAAEEAAAQAQAEAEAAAALADLDVNVMVLNGTTGFGMAKLIADAADGQTALNYNISVETDASNVTAALISGSVDIAALPTNAAATVYNKTEGGVQMAAINTLGVLYLVVNTEKYAVEDYDEWAELDGMTVYAPAQNPSFILQAVTAPADIDLTIDNTYAQPADLRTALAAGEIDIAVLPEPMVTIACAANENLAVAIDLTKAWDTVYPTQLVQGCVVVRTEFAQEHPEAVATFLEEYDASIAFLSLDIDAAAQMIEDAGIFAQAAVAKKAIPNCNVCFLSGSYMADAMDGFCQVMYEIEPASIGGAIPAEDFYFLG